MRGFIGALPLLLACRGPLAKVEALRDALVAEDAEPAKRATSSFPVCAEPFATRPEKGCLQQIATAFGSKNGFNMSPPDQAAAASVALLLVREKRGDWVPAADTWMQSIRGGKGPGADALRLATARQMASAAADVGKKADDEKTALAMMKAIGVAIPGACGTYTARGGGSEEKSLALDVMPDHSPSAQTDDGRKHGPGGAQGRGVWRAAGGAGALWKDEARALREGLALMGGKPRASLEERLAKIDQASAKIELKKLPREDEWIRPMQDAHSDAGVSFVDAGARR